MNNTQSLQRGTRPTVIKVQLGDVVNILRPDMVSKDKSYVSQSRPHIVVELKPDGSFIGIPFSTSCDGWGERVINETFYKGVGGRTDDGWLCPNRTKSFTVNDLRRTEQLTYLRWKQGHIPVKSEWMELVNLITRRWVNFKKDYPSGLRFRKPYPEVTNSSYEHYNG
jgi:hypothetical protein